MKYDEFIAEVQQRTRSGAREVAEAATAATLTTLAERLAGGEAKDLASQLPVEIGQYLLGPTSGMGQPFSLDEFFWRVSEREGVDMLPVLSSLSCQQSIEEESGGGRHHENGDEQEEDREPI